MTYRLKSSNIIVSKETNVTFNTEYEEVKEMKKNITYGYCRISTNKQSIDRQSRNIERLYPGVVILKEVFTGTKTSGRKVFEKLLKNVEPGDTIVFDSVSRMSRNAEEGFTIYEDLFNQGVNLEFIKEPHINTDVYKRALTNQVALTGDKVDFILKGVNEYLMALAKDQIRIAFEQAEKEVTDLSQRTKEGLVTAKLNGKQIGQKPGAKLNVKKAEIVKERILELSKEFNGTLSDKDVMQIVRVARNTYYKYKRELKEEV